MKNAGFAPHPQSPGRHGRHPMAGHERMRGTPPGPGRVCTRHDRPRDEIDREIELNEAEYERGRAAAAAGEQALRS